MGSGGPSSPSMTNWHSLGKSQFSNESNAGLAKDSDTHTDLSQDTCNIQLWRNSLTCSWNSLGHCLWKEDFFTLICLSGLALALHAQPTSANTLAGAGIWTCPDAVDHTPLVPSPHFTFQCWILLLSVDISLFSWILLHFHDNLLPLLVFWAHCQLVHNLTCFCDLCIFPHRGS